MKNRKRRDYLGLLLLLVVGLSVGYALLRTNLTINGTSKIKGNTWDIHFENLNVTVLCQVVLVDQKLCQMNRDKSVNF